MIDVFSLEPVPADATPAGRTADCRPPVPPDLGSLKIELDLSSGTLAAAQLFPQVKDRLTQQEYLDWTRLLGYWRRNPWNEVSKPVKLFLTITFGVYSNG